MKKAFLITIIFLILVMLSANTVTALFDMEVTSINAQQNILAGNLVTIDINISNNGPDVFIGSGYELWTQRGDATTGSIDLTGINLAQGESTMISETHVYPYGANFHYDALYSFYSSGVDSNNSNDWNETYINVTALNYDLTINNYNNLQLFRNDQETFQLTITNNGNVINDFNVTATDLINGSSNISSNHVSINPSVNSLLPGESTTIDVTVDTIGGSVIPAVHEGQLIISYYDGYNTIEIFKDLTAEVLNENPVINVPNPQNAIVGLGYYLDLSAWSSDPFDTLQYDLLSGPSGMNLNSITGVITWTPTSTTAVNVNVQVIDGRGGLAAQTFTIQPVADVPAIKISDNNDLLLGGVNQDRGVSTSTTVEILNTGTELLDITNLELLDVQGNALTTPYNPVISVSSTSIVPFGNVLATITTDVPLDAAARKILLGKLLVEADGITNNVSDYEEVFLQAKSNLEIIDVDITVDGVHEDVSSGEIIDAEQSSTVSLTVELEALTDLENVYYEINDDEDFDIDYHSSEKTIDDGDEESLTINFDLPETISEDDCEVTISAYGEDVNGLEHFAEFVFELSLNKETDDLEITGIEWLGEQIGSEPNSLKIIIRNTGLEDQNDFKIELLSEQNVVLKTELLTYLREGVTKEFYLNINFDNSLFSMKENNVFKILLYDENEDLTDYQTIDLTMTEEISNPVIVSPSEPSIVVDDKPIVSYGVTKSTKVFDEDLVGVLLILAAMILLIILIVMIIKHSRKED